MAKTSWFDDKAEHPILQERATKLDSVHQRAGRRRRVEAGKSKDRSNAS